MKKSIYIIAGLVALMAASCGKTVNPSKKIKTSLDSFSYLMGIQLGQNMKSQGLDKIDYSSLMHGIEDGMKKDSGFAINEADFEKVYSGYVMKEQKKAIEKVQKETKDWLAANAKKGGVQPLVSGGQIKIIQAGNGSAPQPYDTVEYHLFMKNGKGKEIMNTMRSGRPARFPLSMLTIAQLKEAFEKSSVGSEVELYLNSDLIPELSQNARGIDERFGVTIINIKLLKVIPGKPAPAKAPEKK